MTGLRALLARKVAGVPVYVIFVVGVAGVAFYLHRRKKAGGGSGAKAGSGGLGSGGPGDAGGGSAGGPDLGGMNLPPVTGTDPGFGGGGGPAPASSTTSTPTADTTTPAPQTFPQAFDVPLGQTSTITDSPITPFRHSVSTADAAAVPTHLRAATVRRPRTEPAPAARRRTTAHATRAATSSGTPTGTRRVAAPRHTHAAARTPAHKQAAAKAAPVTRARQVLNRSGSLGDLLGKAVETHPKPAPQRYTPPGTLGVLFSQPGMSKPPKENPRAGRSKKRGLPPKAPHQERRVGFG